MRIRDRWHIGDLVRTLPGQPTLIITGFLGKLAICLSNETGAYTLAEPDTLATADDLILLKTEWWIPKDPRYLITIVDA
jgi:hypothetical protein